MVTWLFAVDAQGLQDLKDVVKKEKLLEELVGAPTQAATETMERTVPVDTGRLKASINDVVTSRSNSYYEVTITAPAQNPRTGVEYAIFVNNRAHSRFFDFGFQAANDALARQGLANI